MKRLAVDIIDTPTVSYCVRVGKESTEIAVDCDAADLRALKSCIETTLDEPGLTTCVRSGGTAVAIHPTREGPPSYQVVVTTENSMRSLSLHQR